MEGAAAKHAVARARGGWAGEDRLVQDAKLGDGEAKLLEAGSAECEWWKESVRWAGGWSENLLDCG